MYQPSEDLDGPIRGTFFLWLTRSLILLCKTSLLIDTFRAKMHRRTLNAFTGKFCFVAGGCLYLNVVQQDENPRSSFVVELS